MDLQEYQSQATSLLRSFYDQALSAGLSPIAQTGPLTSGSLVPALLARCSRYAPGANAQATPPEVNDFDILLEAFSAQITAMALTYGMRALPDAFDQVPGMPGGVR